MNDEQLDRLEKMLYKGDKGNVGLIDALFGLTNALENHAKAMMVLDETLLDIPEGKSK